MEKPDSNKELLKRLEQLQLKQHQLNRELHELRKAIQANAENTPAPIPVSEPEEVVPTKAQERRSSPTPALPRASKAGFSLENWIGQNLFSLIGITVLVIGIGIGAKYAIERQLVSPIVRIIAGHLAGAVLLFLSFRLHSRYRAFSGLLFGGGMAVLYSMTYFAYDPFYFYLPNGAMAVQIVISIATLIGALYFRRVFLAHLGLIGAYLAPLLIGEGDQYSGYLVYLLIVNAGILFLAFRKGWHSLNYSSFGLSWVLFAVFCLFASMDDRPIMPYLLLTALLFLQMYLALTARALFREDQVGIWGTICLGINGFLFLALGFGLLDSLENEGFYWGLLAGLAAFAHSLFSAWLYRLPLDPATKWTLAVLIGMATISVMISLGQLLPLPWNATAWMVLGVSVFGWSSQKDLGIVHTYATLLMLGAFCLLLVHYQDHYFVWPTSTEWGAILPFRNGFLISGILLAGGFWIGAWVKKTTSAPTEPSWEPYLGFVLFLLGVLALYVALFMEIQLQWLSWRANSPDSSGSYFQQLWQLNHALAYVSVVILVLARIGIPSDWQRWFGLALLITVVGIFLLQGSYALSSLAELYLQSPEGSPRFVWIRYLSYAFLAGALVVGYRQLRRNASADLERLPFDFLIMLAVLVIASQELIFWLDQTEGVAADKLGLSILWGAYALLLVAIGIARDDRFLRIAAICLFGVTLIKLFFYDIAHLDTLAKTIVFVALGILLLLISYLYNKYRSNEET